ncbi:MAG: putative transport system permease protein, partial [Actinomycetota bacterium]|nr:putative transport system permease protein [Actinomycetota bacterium]
MALARYWFRSTFRVRWRGYVGAAVLLGVMGGLSLFALAGARRTQSAYPRFLRSVDASTMAVDTGQYDPATSARIAHFPHVMRSQVYVAPAVAPLRHGQPDFSQNFEALASLDGRFFEQDRFTATDGRLPDPRRVREIAVNEAAADAYGYRVGQVLDLGTYDLTKSTIDYPGTPALRMRARITAVGLFPNEVLQDDTDRSPLVLFTPAYTRRALPYVQYEWQGLTLEHGDVDVAAVKQHFVNLLDPGSPQFVRVTSTTTFHVEQAVRPLTIALVLFGAIAGLAGLVLVAQALARQLRSEDQERGTLRAMGATPRATAGATALGPLLTVVAGTALAVVLAALASPIMPIGQVGRVEVAPGFDLDWTVLGLGALALLFVLGVFVVFASRRVAHRRAAAAPRPSKVLGAAHGTRLSPAALAGIQLAVEPGRGSSAVPVRSVMAGVAVAVIALTAAVTFGSSLSSLVHTPRLYGWAWDTTLVDSGGYGEGHVEVAQRVFGRDPNIDAFAGGYFGTTEVDASNVPVLGVTPGASVHPPIIDGRSLETASEVVLGTETIATLGKQLGDTVQIRDDAGRVRRLRIVGTATLPTIGIVHGSYTSLGVGAMFAQQLVPGYRVNIQGGGYTGPNVWFVKYRDGVDRRVADGRLRREIDPIASEPGSLVVTAVQRPAEIVNATDVGAAPTVLAGALAVASLASLGLALATSVRRRRRDLALLKVLGFTGRQVAATVRWQAAVTVAVGVLIGVPLGIIAGRMLWVLFADQLDVVPEPSTPLVLISA